MKGADHKETSIYIELAKLLTLSAFIAMICGFALYYMAEKAVDRFYLSTGYVEAKDQENIGLFQSYVDELGLSVMDTELLDAWALEQRDIQILRIYVEGFPYYDSRHLIDENDQEIMEMTGYYDWGRYYQVNFAEGPEIVSIYGSYGYSLYNYALAGVMLLSFLLFLSMTMLGVRSSLAYIRTLKSEVQILESGDLDYAVTLKGRDELAALAGGLEEMRIAMKKNNEKEQRVTKAFKEMVTEMSHDLRTPLTSILIYTGILTKGQYHDEAELNKYLEKIEKKALHMKRISDHLFEYSLVSGGEGEKRLKSGLVTEAFYDALSEIIGYLEQQGFIVTSGLKWENCAIWYDEEDLMRILDNVTSNIIKYADPSAPIVLESVYTADQAGFSEKNRIRFLDEKPDSSHIGIANIRNMMARSGGEALVDESFDSFRISLLFSRKKNEN